MQQDIEPNIKAKNKAKKLIDESKYGEAIDVLYSLKIKDFKNG